MSRSQSTANLRSSRYRAWETRRAKYGPKGYSAGAYRSAGSLGSVRKILSNAIDELSQARCACQLLLPEKAAHRAIDRIDNAWHMLEQL